MQLPIDIIDAFKSIAYYVGGGISGVPMSQNLFAGAWITRAEHRLTDTELIVSFPHDNVDDPYIAFSEIAPTEILSLEVDPPVVLRESVESVELDTWNNAGSTPLEEDEKWTEEHTITEQTDIMASIEIGIKEKLGAEYAGFKAEVEAHLTAKLGINHSTNEQNRVLHEHEQKITIPAWKSVSLTQKKSISDFKQTVRMKCLLDAKIRINGGWEKKFDSLKSFVLYMKGGGGGTGDVPELDSLANQRKFKGFELDLNQLAFTVERERVYKDVRTGTVDRTEIDIK